MNVDTMLARFAEHWSPKRIAQVNDYDVTGDVSGELAAEIEQLA